MVQPEVAGTPTDRLRSDLLSNISQLLNVLLRVGAGESVERLELRYPDTHPVGALTASINEMIESLSEARRVSARYSSELQDKIEVRSRMRLESMDDLSIAYTPGVAAPCEAIARDPGAAWDLTWKGRTVAVVSDGSAVLGLGDLGPLAALPVMEGKAALFREFGGIDAVPIVLDERDPEAIVGIVRALAPTFGGIGPGVGITPRGCGSAACRANISLRSARPFFWICAYTSAAAPRCPCSSNLRAIASSSCALMSFQRLGPSFSSDR